MLDLLTDQFYWPGMTKDAELHIVRCDQCIWIRSKPQRVAMENIQATHLLQLVHLDYLAIKVTEGGKDVHMLIIMDHFTQYAQALVTSSQTAKCTAQALSDWFLVHGGLPESIISDQGQNLKVTSFQSCASWQKYRNYILALITHKQTENVNGSSIHS